MNSYFKNNFSIKILPTFFLFLSTSLFASNKMDIDTSYLENQLIEYNSESSIDSLLDQWYLQNSQVEETFLADSSEVEGDTIHYSFIPDSIYRSRLEMLPYEVPMTYNKIVRNYIELYTNKKRDRLQVMIGLSDYYFPIFDDIIDSYGIPNELKYIAIIESALNPRAVSRARAVGLWQFIYGTGKLYGLTMNSLIDERRDPIKATHAACRFLKDLYNIYGDWHLVIAGYNCGPNNVKKAIRRSGGKRNFWAIYRYLPRETRGYVPAFIGATYALNYYKEHNISPVVCDLPQITDTIMVNQEVHLGQISEIIGISIDLLKDMNPQYIKEIVPARGGKKYPVRLPSNFITAFIDNENTIFNHKDSIYFTKEYLQSPEKYIASYSTPPGKNYIKYVYRVKEGDYLGAIASHYNCSVNNIKDWNNLYRNKIYVGQKLVIYIPKKKASKYNLTSSNETDSNSVEVNGGYIVYKVKSGDTIWGITQLFPGSTDDEIRRLNNLGEFQIIQPGQTLKIMKKS